MIKTETGDVLDHHGGRILLECQVCWTQWSHPFVNGGPVPPDWDKCPKGCCLSDLPEDRKDWLKRWDLWDKNSIKYES